MHLQDSSHLHWTSGSRRHLLDAGIFTVSLSRRRSTDGRESDFTLVRSGDWCNVVAPIRHQEADCFIMVRQFRHGSASVTVEFPGGVVDEGETPEEAALRELREESGYEAARLVPLGRTNPNPAFMENTAHTFLASGLSFSGEQNLDQNEQADVVFVPVQKVLALELPEFNAHAIMIAALGFYRRFLDSQ